ncbi:hypothetical protein ANCCAN_00740, partial [Ancylostoma caninum]
LVKFFPAIPVAEPVPVIAAAPIVAASVPVVVAPPAPVVAAAPVIVQEPEHLQPKAEIHNRVSSFHKETGHLSDTSMLLPAKARRLSAKKARTHKKAHKKN